MKLSYFSTATGSSVDHKEGMLRGVSVITEGDAKGHALQIDAKTLEQVKACAETYADGLRVKMDHYTGIDAMVGVLKNFTIDGAQLRADMTLIKAHSDFAKIMEMAETMPGAFGLSIAFSGAPEGGYDGATLFARCTEIYSCDIVDIPAANPTGLFSESMNTTPDTTIKDEVPAAVVTEVTPEAPPIEEAPPVEEAPPIEEAPPADPAPELSEIVADVATFAARHSEQAEEMVTLRSNLADRDSTITNLSAENVTLRADLSAYDAKHTHLTSLHASLKKALGLMPATNIPDVAILDQAKTPEDFRREYHAIADPTARAEFYKTHQAQMFTI